MQPMEEATDSMADFKSREVIVPEVSKESEDNQVSAQVLKFFYLGTSRWSDL